MPNDGHCEDNYEHVFGQFPSFGRSSFSVIHFVGIRLSLSPMFVEVLPALLARSRRVYVAGWLDASRSFVSRRTFVTSRLGCAMTYRPVAVMTRARTRSCIIVSDAIVRHTVVAELKGVFATFVLRVFRRRGFFLFLIWRHPGPIRRKAIPVSRRRIRDVAGTFTQIALLESARWVFPTRS